MRKKVTYLLGAGASANALPTYIDFKDRFHFFHFFFRKRINKHSLLDIFDENFLNNDFKNYSTPDNYAKFLFLDNSDQIFDESKIYKNKFKLYEHFKILLSCFFNFEQLAYNKINQSEFDYNKVENLAQNLGYKDSNDYNIKYIVKFKTFFDFRYNDFFMSILNELYEGELKNIKIINWNYDNQIDLSLSRVSRYKFRHDDVIKLNGNYDIFEKESYKTDYRYEINHNNDLSFVETIENGLTDFLSFKSDISFAWEDKDSSKITKSQNFLQECDAIVIIGYSFPNFNREIDRIIFEKVDISKTKIYVQDINADQVIKKLSGVKTGMDKVAIPYTEINEFLIPNEFWEEKD